MERWVASRHRPSPEGSRLAEGPVESLIPGWNRGGEARSENGLRAGREGAPAGGDTGGVVHVHTYAARRYMACARMRRVIDRTKTISVGPWTVRADIEATKHCYEQTQEVPPEGCGCDPCRNYALVRDQAYPPDVIALFTELGVDPWKPFELSHYSRMPSGLHLYGGWHYVCGFIERGPDSRRSTHRVNATFEIAVTRPEAPRHPFSDCPCIQIDFYTELPWRSDLPEPE